LHTQAWYLVSTGTH